MTCRLREQTGLIISSSWRMLKVLLLLHLPYGYRQFQLLKLLLNGVIGLFMVPMGLPTASHLGFRV